MFKIYHGAWGSLTWLRTTSDYGQAIFWARHYRTRCNMVNVTVWTDDGQIFVYACD